MAAARAKRPAAVIRSAPGQADQGQEDPLEQGHRQVHRRIAAYAQEERLSHDALDLERAVRRRLSPEEGRRRARIRPLRHHQDLEPALDHPAAVRRPDLRRLQRPQAHSGARVRGDDRPQVWRVRADAHVPRPFRRQEGEEGVTEMSQKANPRRLADNEAKATIRMLRVSPQKLNLLAQLIRGKKVSAALADLEFSRKRISTEVRKALESAIANAENNHDLDVDDLVVAQAWVGKDMVMKRFSPRARGRAGRIEKPFANITIVVREVAADEAKAA